MYDMNDFLYFGDEMIAYSVNQSDPRQLNCRSNILLMGKSVIRIIYKETHYDIYTICTNTMSYIYELER